MVNFEAVRSGEIATAKLQSSASERAVSLIKDRSISAEDKSAADLRKESMMNALSAGKDDREGTGEERERSRERVDGVEGQEETVEAKVEIDG